MAGYLLEYLLHGMLYHPAIDKVPTVGEKFNQDDRSHLNEIGVIQRPLEDNYREGDALLFPRG